MSPLKALAPQAQGIGWSSASPGHGDCYIFWQLILPGASGRASFVS